MYRVLLAKDDFDENEKDKILKTFISADEKYLATPNPDSSFSASLLYAIIAFESRKSSDSGGRGGAKCQSYATYGTFNKADPTCMLQKK